MKLKRVPKIYTSYFAKIRNLPDNIVPISICLKSPQGYKGLQYKKLAPNYDFFMKWKETKDDDYYIEHFNSEVLSLLNQEEVLKELLSLSNNRDIALVCYEKPDNFCHRHLVSKWFLEKDIIVTEYDYRK